MQEYLVLPCVDRDHFCMYFFILRIFLYYDQCSAHGGNSGIYNGNHRILR